MANLICSKTSIRRMFSVLLMIIFSLLYMAPYHSSYKTSLSSPTSSSNKVNIAECQRIINKDSIHFMVGNNITNVYNNNGYTRHNYPIYLYSYGGSGNTMTRLLLEYLTNIYTGSIYFDPYLQKKAGFKGDRYVCTHIMAIKQHPENQFYKSSKDKLRHICHKKSKFGHIDILWPSMSAIFIVRNPWKAIFSMYQFKFGDEKGKNLNDHTRHLMKQNWNGTHFMQYVGIGIDKLMKTFALMDKYDKYGYDYIVVQFEKLIDLKQPNIAMDETNKMLKYLYNDEYYHRMKDALEYKMECIFYVLIKAEYERFGLIHRKKADPLLHVTFESAYQYLIDNHLNMLCNLWNIIKERVIVYGYDRLDGMECRE